MKILATKRKFIVIVCIFILLVIGGSVLFSEVLFPQKNLPNDHTIIDTQFEVQEWNLSYVHNKTLIRVTYDELKNFPDFERSMHGVISGPGTWWEGHRVVAWFNGNESDYILFHQIVCENKSLEDCYPNPGVYEYHGQYYMIFSDRIGSHQTYSATPQPTG